MSSWPSLPERSLRSLRHDGLFWRRFAYLGCVYGPEWFKRTSPALIGATIFALVPSNRKGAMENMRRVIRSDNRFAPTVAAVRLFAEFARCFAETMEYYGPRPTTFRIDPPDEDPLAAALRRGRGAIVATGHFGNWDVAAKTMAGYERPVNMVMAREVNETTQEFVRAAREKAGVRIIYSDTSAFSSFNILRALRRNEIVAMQLDRTLGPGGTSYIPFFGAPGPFSSGPFVLARLSQAPLIPVFVPRLGRRHYAIRLSRAFTVPRAATAADMEEVMALVVEQFERIVSEFPTQWFQFSRFWPDSAPGFRSDFEPADEGRVRAGGHG